MEKLIKELNFLSEVVDEKIAKFSFREIIRPRLWRLILSLKVRAWLNRKYGMGVMLEQKNRSRWFHWLDLRNWKWLLPTAVYRLGALKKTKSGAKID